MGLTPETIDKIIEINKAEKFSLGDQDYSTKKLFPIQPPLPPQPDTLYINTLTGLADYVDKEIDETKDPVFYVISPSRVQLMSQLDSDKRREIYIEANMALESFRFRTYFDVEAFIINMQAQFEDGDGQVAKESILRFLATINSSQVVRYVDNGVSQTVHIKAGLTSGSDDTAPVDVPAGPLLLRPYRTFREIAQPASKFIFRMQKGADGQKPVAALFEADGDEWELEAISRIKDWLEIQVEDIPVIA